MREWTEAVQRMLDYIEEHLTEDLTLLQLSRRVGYSPCYCSSQFHRVMGQTLKKYIAGRRLAAATLELRDTRSRILDIAVATGYSSQEALTRAFTAAYGMTPYAYRKNPRPVRLRIRRTVLFPDDLGEKGERSMQQTTLTQAGVRVEYIPAHKYVGIWDASVDNYMDFWSHHDCDAVCGVIDSMSHVADPVVTPHTAGWRRRPDGSEEYFYGFGVPDDYAGEVPEGFEVRAFPGSYYLVFYHPPFDFLKDCSEVMNRVEALAWSYDPGLNGFQWNEAENQCYQRHLPETIGYEVLRPVKRP